MLYSARWGKVRLLYSARWVKLKKYIMFYVKGGVRLENYIMLYIIRWNEVRVLYITSEGEVSLLYSVM